MIGLNKLDLDMYLFGHLAKATLYLASDESEFVTGQWLSPNGGLVTCQGGTLRDPDRPSPDSAPVGVGS